MFREFHGWSVQVNQRKMTFGSGGFRNREHSTFLLDILHFPIERGARQIWRPSFTVKTLMLSLVTVLVSIGNISWY